MTAVVQMDTVTCCAATVLSLLACIDLLPSHLLLLLLLLRQTPPPLQVRLLRRAADVAAGVSYLHSRNVCHGDLKCENVLLRSEPADPDSCMAKVADFGLSRALAYGQVHCRSWCEAAFLPLQHPGHGGRITVPMPDKATATSTISRGACSAA
jgi:serine/threonine protein kinase